MSERPLNSELIMPKRIAVGIDIGMTYSGAAISYRTDAGFTPIEVVHARGQIGARKFPSVVFVRSDTQANSIGDEAIQCEVEGQPGKLYMLFKRDLGTDRQEFIGAKQVTPISLTRDIIAGAIADVDDYLDQMKPRWAKIPRSYTFTYPGNWRGNKIHDFQQAIEQAGITDATLLSEPVATALGVTGHAGAPQLFGIGGRPVFICDLGGGTLDLALIASDSGTVQMKGPVGGNPLLGMSNIDKVLGMMMYERASLPVTARIRQVISRPIVAGNDLEQAWQDVQLPPPLKSELLRSAEVLKREICNTIGKRNSWAAALPNGMPVVFQANEVTPVFRAFNDLIGGEIDGFLNELRTRHNVPQNSIGFALTSGGGSNLAYIKDTVKDQARSATPVRVTAELAGSAVQQGAARYALDPGAVQQLRLNSSFGVKTKLPFKTGMPDVEPEFVERDGTKVKYVAAYDKFLSRGSLLSTDPVDHPFKPLRDNQTAVDFDVLEGEDDDPTNNKNLGTISLPLPPGKPHTYSVRCQFYLGKDDALLHVKAIDPATGKWVERTFEWRRDVYS